MQCKIHCFTLPVIFTFLISCQSGNSQNTLEPKDFKQQMEQPGVVVLDVRSPEEFSDGRIPGALNVDVESKDFPGEIAKLDSSKTYLVYCRSGSRSSDAAEKMEQTGFKNIFKMKGGFPDWEKAGYPMEK